MSVREVGQRLRALRKGAKFTQAELEAASGVGQSHISAIERGAYPAIRIDTANKLASALGVSVDELLGADMQAVAGITDEQALAWLERQNAALAELMREIQRLPESRRQRILDHIDRQIDLLLTLTTETEQHGRGRD